MCRLETAIGWFGCLGGGCIAKAFPSHPDLRFFNRDQWGFIHQFVTRLWQCLEKLKMDGFLAMCSLCSSVFVFWVKVVQDAFFCFRFLLP